MKKRESAFLSCGAALFSRAGATVYFSCFCKKAPLFPRLGRKALCAFLYLKEKVSLRLGHRSALTAI